MHRGQLFGTHFLQPEDFLMVGAAIIWICLNAQDYFCSEKSGWILCRHELDFKYSEHKLHSNVLCKMKCKQTFCNKCFTNSQTLYSIRQWNIFGMWVATEPGFWEVGLGVLQYWFRFPPFPAFSQQCNPGRRGRKFQYFLEQKLRDTKLSIEIWEASCDIGYLAHSSMPALSNPIFVFSHFQQLNYDSSTNHLIIPTRDNWR